MEEAKKNIFQRKSNFIANYIFELQKYCYHYNFKNSENSLPIKRKVP